MALSPALCLQGICVPEQPAVPRAPDPQGGHRQ